MRFTKLVSVSTISGVLLVGVAALAQSNSAAASPAPSTTGTPTPTPTPSPTPVDPGVQSASRGTGAPLSQVANDSGLASFFADGLSRFQEVESVSGTANVGLGPRFNFNQCAGCHAQPAIGGTGPATNPQFAGAKACSSSTAVSALSQVPVSVSSFAAGSTFTPELTPAQKGIIACTGSGNNTIPSFITKTGPTREARFPFFFNGDGEPDTSEPDGGVEDLFTVTGRPDGAAGCTLDQPGFATAVSDSNVIFRIPTPLFGAGLLENLDDSTLLANRQTNLTSSSNSSLGISGTFNHNGNDGTITRFGWKAQNKSLQIFSGEAYNVEMGITNLLFPTERPLPAEDNETVGGTGLPSGCLNLSGNGYPEDASNPDSTSGNASVLDDVSAFANFMRLLAPPPTGGVVLSGSAVSASTISAGSSLFSSIGCATCHNPNIGTTQASNIFTGTGTLVTGTGTLGLVPVPAFSDLELHHMGTGLEDNVSQGVAGGDQFRTAPLWGLGQRIFLLHDGRTNSLITAIADHSSNGSEASTAVSNFNALTVPQKQEVLDFLRSL